MRLAIASTLLLTWSCSSVSLQRAIEIAKVEVPGGTLWNAASVGLGSFSRQGGYTSYANAICVSFFHGSDIVGVRIDASTGEIADKRREPFEDQAYAARLIRLASSAEIDVGQAIRIARDEGGGGSPHELSVEVTDKGLHYHVAVIKGDELYTVEVDSRGEVLRRTEGQEGNRN
jgi:uncharacterized membrane protein YkoI